jgi:catechol 2,3-dioxygenase-like lactoylglutathione lyase family enzyme
MIDHLTLTVRDLARSKAFYVQALAPLGYSVRMDFGEYVGFGDLHKPYFWLKMGPNPQSPMHLAFVAKDRGAVDAFYQAALAAGATDDGAPGPRPRYHANYYGAFVLDPDGHPIEAVHHGFSAAVARKPAPKAQKKKAATRKAAPKAAKKKPKKGAPKSQKKRGRR